MSEVIVQMEFPKNCLGCDLRQIVYGDSYADTDVYCSKENRFVGKRFVLTKDLARPDWCPIVCKLPQQHGRLVDASTVLFEAEDNEGIAPPMPVTVDDYLELFDLPTIVPATERSKE